MDIKTKAGDCTLADYTLADCPANIAGALVNSKHTCSACGRKLKLYGHVFLAAEFTTRRDMAPDDETDD